jgi:predicted nucleotidyltransferase
VTRYPNAATAPLVVPADMSPGAARGLPGSWRRAVVSAVTEAVGPAQVFLVGSRATGEANPQSDCDVSVVLPLRKVLVAARRLPVIAAELSEDFGVSVSVNPVPKLLFDRARHSLYLLKIRTEGLRLSGDAEPEGNLGFSTTSGRGIRHAQDDAEWDTNSPKARRAEVSYLLSAVHALLAGIDPDALPRGSLDTPAQAALRKARTQVAQACLLVRGCYVSTARAAKAAEDLGLVPAEVSGTEGFFSLRRRLLQVLSADPVTNSGVRSAARDLQYVALSALRGRWRLPVLRHHHGVEARLASASLYLLQSLSAEQPHGYDTTMVRRAWLVLPSAIRPQSQDYSLIRDIILLEWASAQPLVGVVS